MRKAKLLQRLVQRFEEGGHPWPESWGAPELERLYVGRHQRAAGAYVWTLVPQGKKMGTSMWGSQWSALECATSATFVVATDRYGDTCIYPGANGNEELNTRPT